MGSYSLIQLQLESRLQ